MEIKPQYIILSQRAVDSQQLNDNKITKFFQTTVPLELLFLWWKTDFVVPCDSMFARSSPTWCHGPRKSLITDLGQGNL